MGHTVAGKGHEGLRHTRVPRVLGTRPTMSHDPRLNERSASWPTGQRPKERSLGGWEQRSP